MQPKGGRTLLPLTVEGNFHVLEAKLVESYHPHKDEAQGGNFLGLCELIPRLGEGGEPAIARLAVTTDLPNNEAYDAGDEALGPGQKKGRWNGRFVTA